MNPLELLGWWILISTVAHSLHMVSGCLSVGPAEVWRQIRESWDGPLGYALFVWTAHFYTGGLAAERE